MRGAADCRDVEAGGCGGAVGELASRVVRRLGATAGRTPRRGHGDSAMPAGNGPKFGRPAHFLHWHLRAGAKSSLRPRLIREKIIGHRARGIAMRVAGRHAFVVAHRDRRAFALLARGRTRAP